jgi:hypothetical protein
MRLLNVRCVAAVDLGLFGAIENGRCDQRGKHADDHDHDHQFEQREAACATLSEVSSQALACIVS